jgi:hypothetical protein
MTAATSLAWDAGNSQEGCSAGLSRNTQIPEYFYSGDSCGYLYFQDPRFGRGWRREERHASNRSPAEVSAGG